MKRTIPKRLSHCITGDGTLDAACVEQARQSLARGTPEPSSSSSQRPRPPVHEDDYGPPKAFSVGAVAFAKGAAGLTKSALNLTVLPDDKIEERRKVCESCPHLKLLKPKVAGVSIPVQYMGCELCGCRYRSKIRLAGEKCPIGKWGPAANNDANNP